jgi:hypothetical protein
MPELLELSKMGYGLQYMGHWYVMKSSDIPAAGPFNTIQEAIDFARKFLPIVATGTTMFTKEVNQ